MEQALRESEERTRLIVAHALDAVITMDLDGRVTSWNPQAEAIFGWRAEAVIGRLLSETIVPPEHRAAHERGLAHFRHTAEGPVLGRRLELTALRRDGTTIPVELAITPLQVEGTTIFSAFVRDITERKTAERALATSAERLSLLHDIDRAIMAAEAPVAIAGAALQRLQKLLGAPRAIVNLFDLATGETEWLAAIGRRRLRLGGGVRFPLALMGDVKALARGELQVVDTAALPLGPHTEALLASGVQTYMVVPMIAGGELIGAVSFGGPPASSRRNRSALPRRWPRS
jgi:PAS domain S-box-containing protein